MGNIGIWLRDNWLPEGDKVSRMRRGGEKEDEEAKGEERLVGDVHEGGWRNGWGEMGLPT